MKKSIFKPERDKTPRHVPSSEYFRAIVAKTGVNVPLVQSETNPQAARNAIFLAESHCESIKAQATIRALMIVKEANLRGE